ncbi:transporter substrate-binding domain-containing protein [Virgibacillus halophilus]|uniref:Transporter substrate-binding domain-containing protein n=1 Tax=Tigheibacillus halophilus TaxID=361280 RepID=A0ABU5C6Y8_9BACI|nr:transporter substrate-binding domain-containing protein [Virgibacillus halophilus]
MKRIYRLLLLLFFLLIITACGSNDHADKKKQAINRVEDAGVIRIGFEGTYQPFNFLNDDNEYAGFDVDVANELASRLGVKTKFVATKWDSLIGGLKADKFDVIIAQMTVTEDRKKSVDFTDPYVVTGSVLVTANDTKGISKLDDIKGKKVGVGGGTTFEEVARSVDGADVTLYKAVTDYIQDLVNGRLDVIINDQLLMSYNIKKRGPATADCQRYFE